MSEERLKRVEVLLETCAKMSVNNQAEIQELREKSQEASEQIIQLTLQMGNLSQLFGESMGVIRTMQSEIKGIQTENQQILNHLFGENQE